MSVLPRLRRRHWIWLGAGLVLAFAAIVLVPRFVYSLSHESTDDAFVDGPVVSVSAQVPGRVARVLVRENERVKAGQPLVEIDPADFETEVAQRSAGLEQATAAIDEALAAVEEAERAQAAARAHVDAASAEAEVSAQERERYRALLASGAVSQSAYDHVAAQAASSRAALEAVRADERRAEAAQAAARAHAGGLEAGRNGARLGVQRAETDLGRTVVRAPVDGTIAESNVRVGEVIAPGQPLMALVDANHVWVTANFKETQIADMLVGQPVEIDVDAYPDRTFRGHVESFQPGTGSAFSLFPSQNATGNFVKVVQRVPVRIAFDERDPKRPLYPGLSAEPHVDTGD